MGALLIIAARQINVLQCLKVSITQFEPNFEFGSSYVFGLKFCRVVKLMTKAAVTGIFIST